MREYERCGAPRIYSVFDAYINSEKPTCLGCSTAYWLALQLIRRVFCKTNLEVENVKMLMVDTLIRKSMFNVIRGISHFGLRKHQPTAVLVVIVWNYTNNCNLNCLYCHQNSGEANERELTTKKTFKAIDTMAGAGVSILTFSGGEPLVRSDIVDAIFLGFFIVYAPNKEL